MIRGALGSRYGISPLGRGVIRPAAGGWWLSGGIAAANCIAAYQPKGAADYAASKANLANPGTYTAADGANYPAWDGTNGWKFDGTNDYLDSGITPVNNQSFSAIIRVSNIGAGTYRVIFGTGSITPYFGIYWWDSNKRAYSNGAQMVITDSLTGGAVLAIGGNVAYRDGVAYAGTIGSFAGAFGYSVLIGAANGSSVARFFQGYVQAFSIYDSALSGPQVAAVSTAMAAL